MHKTKRRQKLQKIKYLFILGLILPNLAFASDTEYNLSGEWSSFYGYAFPSHRDKHKDKRQFFVNTFEADFSAEKNFNDDYSLGLFADIMVGVNKRQYNYSNGLWGHEVYGIFDNPLGRVMFGETYNAAAQFHVGAPSAGKLGLNDSDIVNFIANPNWVKTKRQTAYQTLNSTSINTDGTAAKISYITPEYHNLTLGFSYIPDTYNRTGLVNKRARYAADDGYVAAAYYTADLGFAELESSLGYGIFNQDDKDFSAGLSLYRAGWTLGGSWRKTYVDGGDYPVTKHSLNPRLADWFDGYREGEAWDVGVGYEIGPFKTALSYFESKSAQSDNKDKIWLLSGAYQYNRNLSLYLAGARAEFKGQTPEDSNKGYAAITGFSLGF